MANAAVAQIGAVKIPKLKGVENYNQWKTMLQHKCLVGEWADEVYKMNKSRILSLFILYTSSAHSPTKHLCCNMVFHWL